MNILITFTGTRLVPRSDEVEGVHVLTVYKRKYETFDNEREAREWGIVHMDNYLAVSIEWLSKDVSVLDVDPVQLQKRFGNQADMDKNFKNDLIMNLNPIIESYTREFWAEQEVMMRRMLRLGEQDVSETAIAKMAKFVLGIFLKECSKPIFRYEKLYGYKEVSDHSRGVIKDSLESLMGVGKHSPHSNEAGKK
jgi:hypothetical protein